MPAIVDETAMPLTPSLSPHSSPMIADTPEWRAVIMTPNAERVRVAFATFDQSHGLAKSMTTLAQAGIAAERIGVAGRASALATVREMRADGTIIAAHLVPGFTTLPIQLGQEPLIISDGPFWRALALFGDRPPEPLFRAAWMQQAQKAELERYIANGAILLGARAETTNEQKLITKALLDHCSHRVVTLDFRR